MQDKIFKIKIFEVTHKSVKVFSLEIFRLYGMLLFIDNDIARVDSSLLLFFVTLIEPLHID